MEKPVQWMTMQELRYELERTRPAWEATELDGFLTDGRTCQILTDGLAGGCLLA
jgi:hypothetical protein